MARPILPFTSQVHQLRRAVGDPAMAAQIRRRGRVMRNTLLREDLRFPLTRLSAEVLTPFQLRSLDLQPGQADPIKMFKALGGHGIISDLKVNWKREIWNLGSLWGLGRLPAASVAGTLRGDDQHPQERTDRRNAAVQTGNSRHQGVIDEY